MTPTTPTRAASGVRDQIERYRSAFIAVITMIVIATLRRRLHPRAENITCRAGFRCWAKNYYTLKADLQTAQAAEPPGRVSP